MSERLSVIPALSTVRIRCDANISARELANKLGCRVIVDHHGVVTWAGPLGDEWRGPKHEEAKA